MPTAPPDPGALPRLDPPVRVAVVGLGYWGRKLADRYRQLEGARLVGICDHSPATLAAARTAHPAVPAHASLASLLRDPPELVCCNTW